MSSDKNWAKEYVLDPLTAPQPADETGPGSHFRSGPDSAGNLPITNPMQSVNPVRHAPAKETSTTTTEFPSGYPSPRESPSSHRQEAFNGQSNLRRSGSLGQRFPGDMSHRPLDVLKQEKAVADKARHVTKKHHIQPDGIDRLDSTAAGGAYHHGGPYDATLFARNNSHELSPVNAVASTNQEALKATPKERITDSLQGHRPLDGVATYAPGEYDENGNQYNYIPGENMMIANNPEGGAYRRWSGVKYHPDDIKGKGEPSYTIEKALKEGGTEEKGVEMTDRPRTGSLSQAFRGEGYSDNTNSVGRSGSLSKRLSGGIKRRIGSLKKTSRQDE